MGVIPTAIRYPLSQRERVRVRVRVNYNSVIPTKGDLCPTTVIPAKAGTPKGSPLGNPGVGRLARAAMNLNKKSPLPLGEG